MRSFTVGGGLDCAVLVALIHCPQLEELDLQQFERVAEFEHFDSITLRTWPQLSDLSVEEDSDDTDGPTSTQLARLLSLGQFAMSRVCSNWFSGFPLQRLSVYVHSLRPVPKQAGAVVAAGGIGPVCGNRLRQPGRAPPLSPLSALTELDLFVRQPNLKHSDSADEEGSAEHELLDHPDLRSIALSFPNLRTLSVCGQHLFLPKIAAPKLDELGTGLVVGRVLDRLVETAAHSRVLTKLDSYVHLNADADDLDEENESAGTGVAAAFMCGLWQRLNHIHVEFVVPEMLETLSGYPLPELEHVHAVIDGTDTVFLLQFLRGHKADLAEAFLRRPAHTRGHCHADRQGAVRRDQSCRVCYHRNEAARAAGAGHTDAAVWR